MPPPADRPPADRPPADRPAVGAPAAGAPADVDTALAIARDLDLLGRIASRIPGDRLDLEIGTEGSRVALLARRRNAELALRIERTALRVAAAAARAGLPIVFLKGAALHLSRRCLVAARPACDVDVLTAPDGGEALRDALFQDGFATMGDTRSAHHLAPIGRGNDPRLEIHLRIPGCHPPGSTAPLTLPALEGAGAWVPLDGLPGRAGVPDRSLLAAHAIVHGIEDHGFGADRYPLLRMIGDLVDLRESTAGVPLAHLRVLRWIGGSLTSEEALSALSLADRLVVGELPAPSDTSPAGLLLAHLVAGSLDADYRDALRLRQLWFLARHRPLAVLRRKVGQRVGGLSSDSVSARTMKAAALLSRIIRAEFRVRRRS